MHDDEGYLDWDDDYEEEDEYCIWRKWGGSGIGYKEVDVKVVGHGVSSTGKDIKIIRWLPEQDRVTGIYPDGQKYTVKISGLQRYRLNDQSINEETPMNKYGNQSHDQIFEALIEDQYYTVGVIMSLESNRILNYRVAAGLNLEVGDDVIVASNGINADGEYQMAIVHSIHKNKEVKAVNWVVQKIDLAPYLERQESWKSLYEGVKKSEMAKKKAVLADGYDKVLAEHDPEAAAILTGFSKAPALPAPTKAKKKAKG